MPCQRVKAEKEAFIIVSTSFTFFFFFLAIQPGRQDAVRACVEPERPEAWAFGISRGLKGRPSGFAALRAPRLCCTEEFSIPSFFFFVN